MKILLDQCVPRRYLRLLKQWGHDVSLLNEHIAPASEDADVIALAGELGAVLLTIDLDFANIVHYPPANYNGIIVLRYHLADEARIDQTLRATLADLSDDELPGALVIISPGRYRIRR